MNYLITYHCYSTLTQSEIFRDTIQFIFELTQNAVENLREELAASGSDRSITFINFVPLER